tara:strand:- start:118 stop:915 length:798 start_codon:yes stop_codon:yes gene_type:complete
MYNNKKKPYVTIITPNYNGSKYLEKTIKSVINQTNKNFEYLVFDACSNDASLKIINKYKKNIDHISIKKDFGIYHAMTKAIKKSKGNVIVWINSDDILDKDAVSNVIKIFKFKKKTNWISGINGYIKNGYIFSGIPYWYPRFIIKKGFAHHNFWGFIQQESTAFRKNFFLKHGYFLNYNNNACDYHLWKKFAKISKLETYYIKIGYFRSWPGQNSKVQERKYYSDTGIKKYFISLRHIRLVASLFMLPYFYLNSLYVLSKYKLTK